MKKLFLLSLTLLTLIGCGPAKENASSETVDLTVQNFGKYIAVNTSSSMADYSNDSLIYYSYFIGSSYCRFEECKVTYKYVSGTNAETVENTVSLTISGDGQAEPIYVRNNGRTYYKLVVVSASGKVIVYN